MKKTILTVALFLLLAVGLALPRMVLAQTYSTIWSDGFDGNLNNWVQGSSVFTYSTTQNKGGYTGAGAAYGAAAGSAQMYRQVNGGGRPFAQGHVTGYFYDNKGGWKPSICGSSYRQALSLRNGSSIILDNGFYSSTDNTKYFYRSYGGTGNLTAYATRWAATTCVGAWI